jgi:hypothetical protein
VWILQKETDLARSFKRIKKMGRLPFHYERPIFPLLLKQLLQKQRYTTKLADAFREVFGGLDNIGTRVRGNDISVVRLWEQKTVDDVISLTGNVSRFEGIYERVFEAYPNAQFSSAYTPTLCSNLVYDLNRIVENGFIPESLNELWDNFDAFWHGARRLAAHCHYDPDSVSAGVVQAETSDLKNPAKQGERADTPDKLMTKRRWKSEDVDLHIKEVFSFQDAELRRTYLFESGRSLAALIGGNVKTLDSEQATIFVL